MDDFPETIIFYSAGFGAIAGFIYGLQAHGIGGAIVGLPIGAILGGMVPGLLFLAARILIFALFAGLAVGAIALIYFLWKP